MATTTITPGAGELETDPFPHKVLWPAMPWDLYWKLHACYPKPELVVRGREQKPNTLYQRHAHDVLGSSDIAAEWQEFFAAVTKRAPGCVPLYPGKVGLRYRDKCAVEMDCLFGVNTPVVETGTVKGPHLDNPRELFACLIYFPEDDDDAGGDLGLYRYTTEFPKWFGQRMTSDVELVKRIPYRHNTGVFFLNGPNSLHGVLPRLPTRAWRRYVNIEAEYHRPLFRLPCSAT